MQCFSCQKNCKPWLLLKNEGFRVNEDGQNIGDTIHVCSYSCSNKINHILPKPYKHLILNQDDFCWLRPIIPSKKKEFTYLTHSEILLLTDDEKINYYNKVDEQLEFNSEKKELLTELENEDKNTYYIENYSSDELEHDDY